MVKRRPAPRFLRPSSFLGSSLYFLLFAYFVFTHIITPSSSKIENLRANILEAHGEDGEAHSFVSRSLSIEGVESDGPAPPALRLPRAVESRADDDVGEGDATTSTGCMTSSGDRSCCMQYTWPGNEQTQNRPPEIPTSNISRTCAQVKEDNPAAACFDPIVYAYSNSSKRPHPRAVRDYCINFSEACFCSHATCVKYSIFNNDDDKTLVNETHFCGTVTQDNGKLLDSGCYKESRGGRIHEVCICKGDYCNGAWRLPAGAGCSLQLLLALALAVTFILVPWK